MTWFVARLKRWFSLVGWRQILPIFKFFGGVSRGQILLTPPLLLLAPPYNFEKLNIPLTVYRIG